MPKTKRRQVQHDGFLRVTDFSLGGRNDDPDVVVAWPNAAENDIPSPFPEQQQPKTCRVYLEQSSPRAGDMANITLPERKWAEYGCGFSTPSFAAALAQCKGKFQEPQGWGVDLSIYGKDDLTSMRLSAFFRGSDECVILFLSCRASYSKQVDCALAAIMHEMTELDKIYQPILQGAGLTGEDYSGLFLLQFCHCVLSHQRRSLDELQKRQNELLETLSRVNENITSSFLENIARKSFEFDRLHHETIAIISVTEGLLDVMSVSENLKESKKLQRLAVELKRICHDLGLATSTLAPRLEERLKFVEISRNIRESSSLWLLSLMAGIFLPLSLASSLLSMQTRLSDLHYLLYDFCGVIAIFGTLTVVCVRLIRLFASYKGNVHDVFHVHTGIHWAFILPEWMVVLSSFLVGMIKDEGLGLRILGFGTASAIGAFFLIAAVRVFIHYWKKREEITLRAAFVQVITGNQGSTDPTLG